MPPKKRGRPPVTSTLPRPSKRVRVGETSIIGTQNSTDTTESGRPKRSSAAEPNYSTKRAKAPNAKQAASEGPVSTMKTATGSEPIRRRLRKGASELFGKRRPSTTANAEAEISGASKPKRGRPKTAEATDTPAVAKKTTTTGKKAVGRPRRKVAELSTTKAATAKRKTPKGPGNHEVNEDEDDEDVDTAPNSTSNHVDDDDEEAEATELDRQYWLMKAEPEPRIEKGVDVKFSIDDLKASRGAETWDGVRSFGARNNMRAMRKGDLAFFYHSSCKIPGIVGVMEIIGEHTIDGEVLILHLFYAAILTFALETAFDPQHPYYDPKSSRESPRWDLVHVRFVEKFAETIKLTDLRSFAKSGGALEKMQLLRQGRLSVSAVKPKEWAFVLSLAGAEPSRYEKDAEQVEETPAAEGVDGVMNGEDSKVRDLIDGEAAEDGEGDVAEDEMVDVDGDSEGQGEDGNGNGEAGGG
jgi:predicted RNA-binding protein with PUA-like domain